MAHGQSVSYTAEELAMIGDLRDLMGVSFIAYERSGVNATCQSASLATLMSNTTVVTPAAETVVVTYPEPTIPLCLTKKSKMGSTGADFVLRDSSLLANNDTGMVHWYARRTYDLNFGTLNFSSDLSAHLDDFEPSTINNPMAFTAIQFTLNQTYWERV